MSEPNERPAEIRALAGARAFPPLILVLFHYCEAHGYRGVPWFDLAVSKGYLWVEFFFVLSGFILSHVYSQQIGSFWRGRAYPKFLWARLSRLYPLHLATLLLILIMVIVLRALAQRHGYVSIYDEPYHPICTWPTFLANLFLVQAWNLFGYLSWNGAAWFVSVEFLLCLLFPLYLVVARAGWKTALLLIFAGVTFLFLLVDPRHGLDLTAHNGIFRGMAEFGIGIGLQMLFRTVRARGGTPIPEAMHSLAQLAVLATLIYGIYATGRAHSAADLYTALPIMALVFALAFDRGLLARALQMRLTMILGEWSYAIYMGQIPLLQFLRYAQIHLYPAPGAMVFGRTWAEWTDVWQWIEPTLLVLVAIAWGYLLFLAVEKPANKTLRWFIEPIFPRSTTSS